jgi:hypothetical protein
MFADNVYEDYSQQGHISLNINVPPLPSADSGEAYRYEFSGTVTPRRIRTAPTSTAEAPRLPAPQFTPSRNRLTGSQTPSSPTPVPAESLPTLNIYRPAPLPIAEPGEEGTRNWYCIFRGRKIGIVYTTW